MTEVVATYVMGGQLVSTVDGDENYLEVDRHVVLTTSSVMDGQEKGKTKKCRFPSTPVVHVAKNGNRDDVKDNSNTDLEGLKNLVAALSFIAPLRDNSKDVGAVNKTVVACNDSTARTPFTARKSRPQATPPTVDLADDDEDKEVTFIPNSIGTTSSIGTTNSSAIDFFLTKGAADSTSATEETIDTSTAAASAKTSSTAKSSAVRNLRTSFSADAAALAYPLSLPRTAVVDTRPLAAVPTAKPCKKFPRVQTNVPGVGVLRSSVTQRKSNVVPFVAMQSTEMALERDASGLPKFTRAVINDRRCTTNATAVTVASDAYQMAKGVWLQGKGVWIVSPFLGVAECVASTILGVAGQNLQSVEDRVVSPALGALDEQILNPLGCVVAGILGKKEPKM